MTLGEEASGIWAAAFMVLGSEVCLKTKRPKLGWARR